MRGGPNKIIEPMWLSPSATFSNILNLQFACKSHRWRTCIRVSSHLANFLFVKEIVCADKLNTWPQQMMNVFENVPSTEYVIFVLCVKKTCQDYCWLVVFVLMFAFVLNWRTCVSISWQRLAVMLPQHTSSIRTFILSIALFCKNVVKFAPLLSNHESCLVWNLGNWNVNPLKGEIFAENSKCCVLIKYNAADLLNLENVFGAWFQSNWTTEGM